MGCVGRVKARIKAETSSWALHSEWQLRCRCGEDSEVGRGPEAIYTSTKVSGQEVEIAVLS